jgi:hemerythrin-like metal-binding protein
MPGYTWDRRYELGVPELDEQHRQYFKLVEALHVGALENPPDRGILRSAIARLLDHARQHFQAEEAFMEKIRYPVVERQRHVEAHDAFVEQVSQLAQSLKSGAPEDARGKLATFISNWLVDHILETDVKYIHFFTSRQG